MSSSPTFSRYQIKVIAILAFLQFTIILDFMILAPLGALLMQQMGITTRQFGAVVSAYAFSAGISGLLSAGFADKFDRKRLLLFFYCGFVLGTFLCGIAGSYPFLLGARIITGLFGGVIGSISFAIIADLFPPQVRGRVMGTVQTAFAASQVMGIPLGVYLSNDFGWHAPFLMIAGISLAVGIVIALVLKPIDAHLKIPRTTHPVRHLLNTVKQPRYIQGLGATALLATGGFMLMPFGSAFCVHNMGIPLTELHVIYMVTGISSIISGPLMGKLSDAIGKYAVFCAGTVVASVVVVIYCNRGITPLSLVIVLNIILFAAIMARMISSSALTTSLPDLKDRGAYMAVSSSLQQLSGGIAAWVAGLIVIQTPSGALRNYDILGYVVVAAMMLTMGMLYFIHKAVQRKLAAESVTPQASAAVG